MKYKAIILCLMLMSCQTESDHSHFDWIEHTDRMITAYDKVAGIKSSNTLAEDNHKTEMILYNESSDGMFKVEWKFTYDKDFPINMEVYFKNDKVIVKRFSGLSPYFHKRRKKEGDKCCALFEEVTYFKSSTEVIQLERKLDLMTTSEKELRKHEFESLGFTEIPIDNPGEAYREAMTLINEVKDLK